MPLSIVFIDSLREISVEFTHADQPDGSAFWEFIKLEDGNYQIKTSNHFYFIFPNNDIMKCDQILGKPTIAKWSLEICE